MGEAGGNRAGGQGHRPQLDDRHDAAGDGRRVSTYPYTVVDVFTDTPLEGNPVAVFHDGSGLERRDDAADGAGAQPVRDGVRAAGAERRRRAGADLHPVGGAPVRGASGARAPRSCWASAPTRPSSGSRPAPASSPVALRRDGREVVFGEMDQPMPVREPFEHAAELLRALGVGARSCRSRRIATARCTYTWRSAARQAVAALRPDLAALQDLGEGLGVSCFARQRRRRFKTRMFAPALGVPEDPATGSAAGPLARPSRPPRLDRLRRADRDPSGRGDPAPLAAARARRADRTSGSSGSPSAAAP